jgi:hypothetical protein
MLLFAGTGSGAAATVDGANIHWTSRGRGTQAVIQIADPAPAGPPPRTVTGPARENMIRGMFSGITTPALQQHILKM